MVEFGDELIIESYRIPWLIWVQLLVTLLLIVLLLFGFTVFTLDPATSSAAALPSTGCSTPPPTHLDNPTSSNRIIPMEDQGVTRDAGTSGGSVREEDRSGEESSLKDSMFLSFFRRPIHPCNYIGRAKQAFFKCFGLDSSSESSSSRQHEKRD